MNYYPFHLGDYISDTAHLNIYEDLAYRRLIDLYYQKESPIEADLKKVIKRIRMTDCDGDVESVLNEYFTIKAGFYHHSRCDEEIAKYRAKADSARSNGKKGGRPKKPKKTQSVNLANPEETGSKANQEPEPITNNQTKKKGTKRFTSPSILEIQNYISEKNYQVDAERFLNHYESNGWMVGKTKMKDWKAAIRNWHSRNKDKQDGNEKNRKLSAAERASQQVRDFDDHLRQKQTNNSEGMAADGDMLRTPVD